MFFFYINTLTILDRTVRITLCLCCIYFACHLVSYSLSPAEFLSSLTSYIYNVFYNSETFSIVPTSPSLHYTFCPHVLITQFFPFCRCMLSLSTCLYWHASMHAPHYFSWSATQLTLNTLDKYLDSLC